MEDKLRLLAEKLVKDGLVQAEAERTQLLAEARAEAERIIQAAERDASSMRQAAEQEAAQLQLRVRSELQQLGRRAKEGLRADLRHLIQARVVQEPVARQFEQDMPGILRAVIQHLYRDAQGRLEIRLPEGIAAELRAKMQAAVQDLLQSTPVLGTDARIGHGFSIQREGEQYVIDFTAADFEAVLLGLLSDDLQKLLHDAE